MSHSGKNTFGSVVRRERMTKDIGLREMAKMIGVSPTYLSLVERDQLPPPAEERVKKIADILELDADELLALSGRVSSDLLEIIKAHPREFASLLRSMRPTKIAQHLTLIVETLINGVLTTRR